MPEHVWLSSDGRLVGVLNEPHAASGVLIVFLTAGYLPRFGPNRVYVKLARALAAEGLPSLRFDLSGVGDSKVVVAQSERQRSPGWATEVERQCAGPENDIRQALKDLTEANAERRFVLFGMCRSVGPALAVALTDPRVVGLFLVNGVLDLEPLTPSVKQQLIRKTQRRYYAAHMFSPESWRRLLTGRSQWRTLVRALLPPKRVKRAGTSRRQQSGILTVLHESGLPTRIVFSEGSPNWDAFSLMHLPHLSRSPKAHVTWSLIRNADHTFTPLASQNELTQELICWVNQLSRASWRAQ